MLRLNLVLPLNHSPIGVFDSGIGGLTVLRAIHERLPLENTVYLGDTARLPYGTKSAEAVIRYSIKNAEVLMTYGIKMLVVACNTASAVALPELEKRLPIPVLGVIVPGARAAAKTSASGRIAVIGTPGTIQSGAYERALREIKSDLSLLTVACPLFVPLAEEGWTDGEVPSLVAQRYLGAISQSNVDTLVLGCTHYPLLSAVIQQTVGKQVTLVDSAHEAAMSAAELLTARKLLNASTDAPLRQYLVTDVPNRFILVGGRFLGKPIVDAKQIDLAFG